MLSIALAGHAIRLDKASSRISLWKPDDIRRPGTTLRMVLEQNTGLEELLMAMLDSGSWRKNFIHVTDSRMWLTN